MKKILSLALGVSLLAGGVALLGTHNATAKEAMPKMTPVKVAKHAIIGQAPDFALKSATTGKTVKLSDYKGKVRIVDFWATWCPPCRGEIPHFVDLQKKYGKKGLQIIGVSVDQDGPSVVSKFMTENHINYPVAMADDQVTNTYGGIRGIPTTFVIDREGNIVKKYIGSTEESTFESDIKALF